MADDNLDPSNGQDDNSLGSILEASFDKVEAENPVEETPSVEETETPTEIDTTSDAEPADEPTAEPVEPAIDPNAAPNPDVNDIAPEGFTAAAKAEWANVPASVKSDITRRMSEMEAGINGYKEKLEPYQGLEQFAELAQQGGTTLQAAMQNYHGMEQQLRADPIKGFQRIAANMGINFNQLAAQVANVAPNQQAMQYEQTINSLRNELFSVQNQMKTIDQRFTQQDQSALEGQISDFSQGKEHFETVREDMATLIQIGKADDLQSAYDMAVKINRLKNSSSDGDNTQKDKALAAQTQKGSLSVSGAPNKASKALNGKGKHKSTRAALEDAFSATS